jgi:hypothetical protein
MTWLIPMNTLFAILFVVGLALGAPQHMRPHILMGDSSHCDSIVVRNRHIAVEKVCSGNGAGGAEVAWDGHGAVISAADEKASAEWIRAHSLLKRLSTHGHDLYWDGEKVDLVDVFDLYEAISWQVAFWSTDGQSLGEASGSPGRSRGRLSRLGTSNRFVQSTLTRTRSGVKIFG